MKQPMFRIPSKELPGLEGGQLGCLNENAASTLFRRLNELEEGS